MNTIKRQHSKKGEHSQKGGQDLDGSWQEFQLYLKCFNKKHTRKIQPYVPCIFFKVYA